MKVETPFRRGGCVGCPLVLGHYTIVIHISQRSPFRSVEEDARAYRKRTFDLETDLKPGNLESLWFKASGRRSNGLPSRTSESTTSKWSVRGQEMSEFHWVAWQFEAEAGERRGGWCRPLREGAMRCAVGRL